MLNYKDIISKGKVLIIAPAGYGKTHTIAECLRYCQGRQLILTHTHAGIAALKEKIKKQNIPDNQYRVETITSFARKYFNAFSCRNNLSEVTSKEYWKEIIEEVTILIQICHISDIIKYSYKGLFVDEYQDCTRTQHRFIMVLSDFLTTRILGDPLQGIFNFNKNDPIVDWEEDIPNEFKQNTIKLVEPWRWKQSNPCLGNCLKTIRDKLNNRQNVNLKEFEEHIQIINDEKEVKKLTWNYLNTEQKVLLIYPYSDFRYIQFAKQYHRYEPMEAIDNKDFYEIAVKIDQITPDNLHQIIHEISSEKLFTKGAVEQYIKSNRFVKKNNVEPEPFILIKQKVESYKNQKNLLLIAEIIEHVKNLPKVNCARKELFSDTIKSIKYSFYHGGSVFDAMKKNRDQMRKSVRNAYYSKRIGTTLLSKGLEFDVAIIYQANGFKCHKNFYVAVTRASNKLIIYTKTPNLCWQQCIT